MENCKKQQITTENLNIQKSEHLSYDVKGILADADGKL